MDDEKDDNDLIYLLFELYYFLFLFVAVFTLRFKEKVACLWLTRSCMTGIYIFNHRDSPK